MRVLSTATAVLAFERGTVTTSSAFQVLVPSSGSGRSTAAARRSSSNKAFPWAASSFRRRAAAVPLWCTSQTTDVAATAEGKGPKKEEGRGHGHGGGVKPKTDKNSFVQWDMRRAAMKLHTRDQSPKEGKQENKGTMFSDWKPSRRGYLQFLVDSKVVYEALEQACGSDPRLAGEHGFERTEHGPRAGWGANGGHRVDARGVPGLVGGGAGRGRKGSVPDRERSGVRLVFEREGGVDAPGVHVPLLQPLLCAHGGGENDRPQGGGELPRWPNPGVLPVGSGRREGVARRGAGEDRRHGQGLERGGEGGVRVGDGENVQVRGQPLVEHNLLIDLC
ncbi:unnamed protein product [Ectocarpus sp. 6 AP-2014]